MRLFVYIAILIYFSFNPRICKRCDALQMVFKSDPLVSIHASVKDATYSIRTVAKCVSVSIHASVKDATFVSPNTAIAFSVSIHASVKDATGATRSPIYSVKRFNPRICKRCDRPVLRVLSDNQMFQSTHL